MKWLQVVGVVCAIGLLFAALMTVVIVVGLGAGYCTHWLVPDIDLGMAALIGVLSFLGVVRIAMQVLQFVGPVRLDETDADIREGEGLSDDQVEYVADQVSEAVLENLDKRRGNRGHSSRTRSRR